MIKPRLDLITTARVQASKLVLLYFFTIDAKSDKKNCRLFWFWLVCDALVFQLFNLRISVHKCCLNSFCTDVIIYQTPSVSVSVRNGLAKRVVLKIWPSWNNRTVYLHLRYGRKLLAIQTGYHGGTLRTSFTRSWSCFAFCAVSGLRRCGTA